MTAITARTFTTRDGIVLAADAGGRDDAPTVILLHGGGQTRHSWAGELDRLVARGYRGISYDARGHGESGWSPDGDYSIGALAADLETVLAECRRPLVLIGASMGGITSLYAIGNASRDLADALILVDIVPRPARAGADRIRKFMTGNPQGFATLDEAIDAVAAYNPERPRPRNPEGLMRNLRLRDDGRLYWHWDPRLLGMRETAEPPMINDAMRVAGNIRVPTLLVRGGRSDVVDDAGVAEMKTIIPQTEVFDVPAAGHMVAGDDNSAFHSGITGFLERHLPLGL